VEWCLETTRVGCQPDVKTNSSVTAPWSDRDNRRTVAAVYAGEASVHKAIRQHAWRDKAFTESSSIRVFTGPSKRLFKFSYEFERVRAVIDESVSGSGVGGHSGFSAGVVEQIAISPASRLTASAKRGPPGRARLEGGTSTVCGEDFNILCSVAGITPWRP
jgi:hypothetical protein